MNKLTVYLAGYSKEVYYRELVKSKYGKSLNLINPMEILESDLNEEIGVNKHIFIVRRDQKLILQSDIFVAFISIGPTFGTSMEICFSKQNNIPVYVIEPNKTYRYDSWLKYYTTIFFDNIEQCFDFITSK